MSILLTKAYQEVTNKLKQDVLSGVLAPGTRLPSERELAKQMGVSRGVIREAMKVLRTQGIIEIRHGVGTFVSPRPDPLITQTLELSLILKREALSELLELRLILETASANLAALRYEKEDIEELQTHLNMMEMSLGHSLERWNDADLNFHLTIARASKSHYLTTLLNTVLSLTWEGLHGTYGITGSFQRYYHEHQQIFKSIHSRDSDAAFQIMAEHIRGVCNDLFGIDGVKMGFTKLANTMSGRS